MPAELMDRNNNEDLQQTTNTAEIQTDRETANAESQTVLITLMILPRWKIANVYRNASMSFTSTTISTAD